MQAVYDGVVLGVYEPVSNWFKLLVIDGDCDWALAVSTGAIPTTT